MAHTLYVTSNGVGMGHLSRLLSVALSSDSPATMLSLSAAVPTLEAAQHRGQIPAHLALEYCPSRMNLPQSQAGISRLIRSRVPQLGWDSYFRDRLIALAAERGATTLIFDGVVPYRGLRQAREQLPQVKFVWNRRGMWQPGVGKQWLDHAAVFDLIIEPGDFAQQADVGLTAQRQDAHRVAPMSMVDVLPSLSQSQARRLLNLPQDRPILLLALGSGALADLHGLAAHVTAAMQHHPDWLIVVPQTAISNQDLATQLGLTPLEHVFPLAHLLPAFDAAVSAAGYNSVHELLSQRIPTLFMPSHHHRTDDQPRRAAALATAGYSHTLTQPQPEQKHVSAAVKSLLQDRDELKHMMSQLPRPTGGREAANLLQVLTTNWPAVSAEDALAHVAAAPPRFASLRIQLDQPLIFTQELPQRTPARLKGIEHLIPNASPAYQQARHRIAHTLYNSP